MKHIHELQFVEKGGVQCSTLGCDVYYSDVDIIHILERLANENITQKMNAKEKHLAQCADALQRKYGLKSIWIKITSAYLDGSAWFDDLVNKEIEVFGIDIDSIPKMYLNANGDGIPFTCGEYSRAGISKEGWELL